MRNLLRCELTRIRKDKLFLWIVLITAAWALLPIANWLLVRNTPDASIPLDVRRTLMYAVNFNDLIGNIMPMLVACILFKTFSQGTVRNHIITGTPRTSIFFSQYLSALVLSVGVVLSYALISTGLDIALSEATQRVDIWPLLGDLALSMNLYLFLAAVIAYLCVSSKSIGTLILKYLGVFNILPILGGLLQMRDMVRNSVLRKALDFLHNINVFNYNNEIIAGEPYSKTQLGYMIVTPLALTALLLFLGWRKMQKKDIK